MNCAGGGTRSLTACGNEGIARLAESTKQGLSLRPSTRPELKLRRHQAWLRIDRKADTVPHGDHSLSGAAKQSPRTWSVMSRLAPSMAA